ncbi:MAG: thioredoxin [Clostridia bacterium]|nr:thioredoxin [Clostridia bacterium]
MKKERKITMAIEFTTENFENEVLKNNKPVLVDFWASWCGPCRMFAPVIEEFAEETQDVIVGKVNVDDYAELASAYGIATIPTLILFKNGQEQKRHSGLMSAKDLKEFALN